jgi:hypothetical protein
VFGKQQPEVPSRLQVGKNGGQQPGHHSFVPANPDEREHRRGLVLKALLGNALLFFLVGQESVEDEVRVHGKSKKDGRTIPDTSPGVGLCRTPEMNRSLSK